MFDQISANIWPILIGLFVVISVYLNSVLKKFSNNGIPTVTNNLALIARVLTSRSSAGETVRDIYLRAKSQGQNFVGAFMPSAIFVPIDPELIKHIMQKDFDVFMNRGVYYNERDDPLTAHLFALEGQKWKNLRAKLTPTFTSGKMKMMFSTVVATNVHLQQVLSKIGEKEPLEIKDILSRLNTDIIGSCAFGLECNSLADPEAEFRRHGRMIFANNKLKNLRRMLMVSFPNMARKLRMQFISKPVSKFFMQTIKDTVKYREENNVYRKDFMHLMIQLKNRGKVADDEHLTVDSANEEKDDTFTLTVEEIAAEAFVFFIAGFETSSSTTSYALYELANNQECQDKLRQEINAVLAKHNGELTYESCMEMHYMEKIINETLRKYPTLPVLSRSCGRDYKIPNSDAVLKKGTRVFIPVEGMHHDPEFYPDPKKWDPERFNEENKLTIHPFTYLPFGEGPRICIGLRFGMLQTKVALAFIIRNYVITLDPKTNVPLIRDPKSFLNSAKGGIFLNIKRIAKT